MASSFYYTGLDSLKLDKSERGTYCTFAIFHRESGVKLAEIITNASLCGSWHWTKRGDLVQDAGTCQYSLPKSVAGIRKALRARAFDEVNLWLVDEFSVYGETQGFTKDIAQKVFELLK